MFHLDCAYSLELLKESPQGKAQRRMDSRFRGNDPLGLRRSNPIAVTPAKAGGPGDSFGVVGQGPLFGLFDRLRAGSAVSPP